MKFETKRYLSYYKSIIFLFPFFFSFLVSTAQLCPGGGTTYANAVFFDPGWISGCVTGTSCNGGTEFDNRALCEPTTAIDACAPSPTCGTVGNMGSDIWFKFYATSSTATIKVIQNVSFIATIQAFSQTGSTCAGLSQIGCVIAGGPSSGVTLSLSSLTAGNLYYFRVFGTSSTPSQRTGTFCFCGSANMTNVALPVKILSFTSQSFGSLTRLKWRTALQINFKEFEIEKSEDGINFKHIGTKAAIYSGNEENDYYFDDVTLLQENSFYRLKMIDIDGSFDYSSILRVSNALFSQKFNAIADPANRRLIIQTDRDGEVIVSHISGQKIAVIPVKKGVNNFNYTWQQGIYIISRKDKSDIRKVYIY